MTPTSFSRFFKLRTGRSLSDYITDIRLGHAARALMDSTTSIAETCYECGFNNISNFNRISALHTAEPCPGLLFCVMPGKIPSCL